jgi:hypothetical protein
MSLDRCRSLRSTFRLRGVGFAIKKFQSPELSCRPPNCVASAVRRPAGLSFKPAGGAPSEPYFRWSPPFADHPRIPARFRVRYGTGEPCRCCGRGTCTALRFSSPRLFCCERGRETWLSPSRRSIQCCYAGGNASGTLDGGTESKGTSSPRDSLLRQAGYSPCTARRPYRPSRGPRPSYRGISKPCRPAPP